MVCSHLLIMCMIKYQILPILKEECRDNRFKMIVRFAKTQSGSNWPPTKPYLYDTKSIFHYDCHFFIFNVFGTITFNTK